MSVKPLDVKQFCVISLDAHEFCGFDGFQLVRSDLY